MNRLFLKRFVMNIFWTLTYGSVIGYVCYYNGSKDQNDTDGKATEEMNSNIVYSNYSEGM